jgi:hypothetical protein
MFVTPVMRREGLTFQLLSAGNGRRVAFALTQQRLGDQVPDRRPLAA